MRNGIALILLLVSLLASGTSSLSFADEVRCDTLLQTSKQSPPRSLYAILKKAAYIMTVLSVMTYPTADAYVAPAPACTSIELIQAQEPELGSQISQYWGEINARKQVLERRLKTAEGERLVAIQEELSQMKALDGAACYLQKTSPL